LKNDEFRQIQEQRRAKALRCSWIAEINHFSMIINEYPTFLECALTMFHEYEAKKKKNK
jgi:hypothetical protein